MDFDCVMPLVVLGDEQIWLSNSNLIARRKTSLGISYVIVEINTCNQGKKCGAFSPCIFMSLARTTLLYEWRRFLPGVLSVAFAGLLMLVQLGLLLGMFGTVTVLVDRSKANLWVTSPETQSMDQAKDIPSNLAALLRLNSAVQHSETLLVNSAVWQSGSTRIPI